METPYLIRKEPTQVKIFRIIPHRSVLNTNTRRFQQILHQLLFIRYPKLVRKGKGFYLRIKEEPFLWWILKVTSQQIEFIVVLPVELADTFLMKLDSFTQWGQCKVEEVPDFELVEDGEHTDLYRFLYTQNDMFSLSYDYREQHTPLIDLMKLSNELKEHEQVSLAIRTSSYSSLSWKRFTDFTWAKWNEGQMVYRRGLNVGRMIKSLIYMLEQLFNEINLLIKDLLNAIEKSFMKPGDRKEQETKWVTLNNPDRFKIEANGGPTTQSKKKANLPVFKTQVYLPVTSKDLVRRHMLVKSVESALDGLSGDNKLAPVKVNIRGKQSLNSLNEWKAPHKTYNLMSTEELGKLEQLPTHELQQEFADKLKFNNHIEVDIASDFTRSGILAGSTTIKGEEIPIYIPTDDPDMLFTPRGIIGSPRMGKDQLAINLIAEANRNHGIGAIIPDVIDERIGHRGMANTLRDHIPADHIIDIDLGNFDHPPYLGLHSLVSGESNDRIISNRIAQELVRFLMGEDIENHQTTEYLREFAKAVKGDLIGIKLMCLSPSYRKKIIAELSAKGWDTSILEQFDQLSEGRQNQITQPIMVRLQQILGDEFLKPIFGQPPNPKVDFYKWMKEGKVVILRIPSRDLGEEAVKIIVYWIVLITFLTRLKMNVTEDKGVFLVLNEPHQFMTRGLAHLCKRILSEGPKYRFAPLIIFHNLYQIEDRSFIQILLSSSLNWFIFKNSNIRIYKELENYLAPTFTPESALGETRRFHYIACWLNSQGEYSAPFMVKAPDPVAKRYSSFNNAHVSSAQKQVYGRPIGEIIRQIRAREIEIFQPSS